MNKDKWITFRVIPIEVLTEMTGSEITRKINFELKYFDHSDDFYNDFQNASGRSLNEPDYLGFDDEAFEDKIYYILKDCIPSEYLRVKENWFYSCLVPEEMLLQDFIDSFENMGVEYISISASNGKGLKIEIYKELQINHVLQINRGRGVVLTFKVFVD